MTVVAESVGRDRVAREAHKKFFFSQLKVELKPGEQVSYLDGVIGHKGQQHMHLSPWKYYVADWGRRTGKTIGAAAEVAEEMAIPGSRSWIVAPTYDLTSRVFDYLWRWLVIDECFGKGSIVKRSNTRDSRYIETKWGSWVRGRSAESPDSLIGEKLDLIVVDEAARIPERIFLECLEPCLMDRQGRILFISTPRGHNWFYEYFNRRLSQDHIDKGWYGSRFSTADNPYISSEWVEARRADTPPDIFRREYEASFEHFTGLIWPMYRDRLFDESNPGAGGHLFDPKHFPLPEGTDYRAIDVGWRHPTACVWGRASRSPEDDIFIYKEYLGEPSVVHEEHAKNVAVLSRGMKIFDTVISPDAKRRHRLRRDGADDISAQDIYEENGIMCRSATDDVMAGISLVGGYFKATLSDNPSHPRIFISTECRHLREQLQSYVYHETNQRREISDPEKPRKYKDDLVDAFRYLVAGQPRYVPVWASGDEADPMMDSDRVRYGYPRSYGAPTGKKRGPRLMGG